MHLLLGSCGSHCTTWQPFLLRTGSLTGRFLLKSKDDLEYLVEDIMSTECHPFRNQTHRDRVLGLDVNRLLAQQDCPPLLWAGLKTYSIWASMGLSEWLNLHLFWVWSEHLLPDILVHRYTGASFPNAQDHEKTPGTFLFTSVANSEGNSPQCYNKKIGGRILCWYI